MTDPSDDSELRADIARLVASVDGLRGRVSAHEVVIELLLKAIASADRDRADAIAMALEVAEGDHVDSHGETDTAATLRRIREQLGFVLPGDELVRARLAAGIAAAISARARTRPFAAARRRRP